MGVTRCVGIRGINVHGDIFEEIKWGVIKNNWVRWNKMALGDAEITFFISSGILIILFLYFYSKICEKPEVSRTLKILFPLLFTTLLVLGSLSIFVFQFLKNSILDIQLFYKIPQEKNI